MAVRQPLVTVFTLLIVALSFLPIANGGQSTQKYNENISPESENQAKRLESGLPFIRTFNYKDYKAKPQNWAVVQDNSGMIYVANSDGVLEFDGKRWRTIKISNGTVGRSIAIAPNGRIYVGAIGEIGYLDQDINGLTRYVSLMDKIPVKYRDFADVWQIYATKKGMVFTSFQRIFRLNGDQFDSWVPSTSYHLGFQVGDRLFAREKKVGLFELVDDKFVLVKGGEKFANERIYAMLPWHHNGQPAILIATRTQGFWVYDQAGFTHWPTDIEQQLNNDLIFPVIHLNDTTLAIGTLQKGVYFVDHNGRQIAHLSTREGLPDNAILALTPDKEGGLWIATDNGLARAEMNNPLTLFDERRDLVGVSYLVYRHQEQLVVGTTHGLFMLQPGARASFKQLDGIVGQTWDVASIGEEMLVANYLGMYSIYGNTVTQLSDLDSVMSIHPSHRAKNRVFVGLREGLIVMQRDQDQWRISDKIKGINDEIRTIYEEESGVLWLGTKATGVIRVTFVDHDFDSLTSPLKVEKFGKADGLPNLNDSWVYPLNQQPSFATRQGIFKFNYDERQFVPDPRFSQLFSELRPTWSMKDDPNRGLWLFTQNPHSGAAEIGLAEKLENNKYQWNAQALQTIVSSATEGMRQVHLDKDGVVWFGGSEGLYRYDSAVIKHYHFDYPAIIRQVSSNKRKVIPIENMKNSTIAYAENTIRFIYSAPSFDGHDELYFSVKLEGNDDQWSDWSAEDYRDYSNLFEGDYRFRVRAKNAYGVVSDEATYSFAIAPPWYRTLWAYSLYLLVTLLLIKIFVQWRFKQVNLQNALLERKVADRTKQLNSLGEIGRAITATLDLDEALEFLYKQLNKMIDASVFGIGLYNPDANTIDFRLAIENGMRFKPYSRDMNDKNQLAVWCIDHQEPVIIGDYANEYSRYLTEIDDSSCVLSDNSLSKFPHSLMYVPLILKGKIIGLISAQSFHLHSYDESHLDILKTLATYTAIAVDNARAHETLEEISFTDPLTDLNNRRFLQHHLDKEVAITIRKYNNWLRHRENDEKQPPFEEDLLFFLIDIDHFKKVNDVYGHSAGDQVLKQVADRLRQVFRESDFLVRWGGEEFLVITRHLPRTQAEKFAERIRTAIGAYEFNLNEQQTISRSCSIGYCCFPFLPQHPELISWSQTIDIADEGLYIAKRNGRNSWVGLLSSEKTNPAELFQRFQEQKHQIIASGEIIVASNLSTDDIVQSL